VSTFTPGPWIFGEALGPDRTILFWEVSQHGAGRYRGHVAHVSPAESIDGITRDEALANARLIASAPDLLDALQDALEYIEACSDVRDGPDGVPQPNRAMQLADPIRAVIAKAEGKA
jgi:hypothetical protein